MCVCVYVIFFVEMPDFHSYIQRKVSPSISFDLSLFMIIFIASFLLDENCVETVNYQQYSTHIKREQIGDYK